MFDNYATTQCISDNHQNMHGNHSKIQSDSISNNQSIPATNKEDGEEKNSIIYLMSILSAMGGFLFGYDTGIVSGAMVFVKDYFKLNSWWQELVVSITILGAWILSIFAGSLSERYGRKVIILCASVIFTIGSIVMGFAWSRHILLIGRLVVGLAIGLASTVVPMYIAEVAPKDIRGSLVTLNNCFITFGQLVAAITAGIFSSDHENGWRWMLSLAAVPSIIQFFGFLFMPESPRWLIRKQRDTDAIEALKRIHGQNSNQVMIDYEQIKLSQVQLIQQEKRRKMQKRSIVVAILRKTATRRALFVGCLLQAVQQLAGINTIMYYAGTIIEMSGVESPSMAVWLVVPTSLVYSVFAFCGYLVADKFGRRTLTLSSLLGVVVALLILGTGFQLKSMDSLRVTVHDTRTASYCFERYDCNTCIRDSRCGFCYNKRQPSIATCMAKSSIDLEVAEIGHCSARALGNFLTINSQANIASKNNNSSSSNNHINNFTFATRLCPSKNKDGIGFTTWLVLAGLVAYLAAFAPGLSPMPWTINSEIYPAWARSVCYSIATSVNWLFNLAISLTFISLSEMITVHGSFYLYSIFASIGWLLLFWKLPETRGRSLEEVTLLFEKKPKLKSSSGDNNNDTDDILDDTNAPSTPTPAPMISTAAIPQTHLKHQLSAKHYIDKFNESQPIDNSKNYRSKRNHFLDQQHHHQTAPNSPIFVSNTLMINSSSDELPVNSSKMSHNNGDSQLVYRKNSRSKQAMFGVDNLALDSSQYDLSSQHHQIHQQHHNHNQNHRQQYQQQAYYQQPQQLYHLQATKSAPINGLNQNTSRNHFMPFNASTVDQVSSFDQSYQYATPRKTSLINNHSYDYHYRSNPHYQQSQQLNFITDDDVSIQQQNNNPRQHQLPTSVLTNRPARRSASSTLGTFYNQYPGNDTQLHHYQFQQSSSRDPYQYEFDQQQQHAQQQLLGKFEQNVDVNETFEHIKQQGKNQVFVGRQLGDRRKLSSQQNNVTTKLISPSKQSTSAVESPPVIETSQTTTSTKLDSDSRAKIL